VTDTAAGHFRPSDQGLLERLCEMQMLAEEAATKLVEGAVVGEKISPWFWVHASATKSMNNLVLRLRLSPQSRSQRAVKTVPGPSSFYDTMMLEDGDDVDGGINPR
jgi:hypothetical protein